MTTKEKIQKFQEEFNPYFQSSIVSILKQQRDFYPSDTFLDEPLNTIITDYTKSGKRIRPFLISFFTESTIENEYVRNVCIAVELFHLAALIHDDIMDGSIIRRGVPTVHVAAHTFTEHNPHLGIDIALLLGDLFLSASLKEAHTLKPRIFNEFVDMIQRTIRGQYLDSCGMNTYLGSLSYPKIKARHLLKTAWYTFGTPSRIGYLIREPDISEEKLEIVTALNNEIGILFQIRDDIIDCIDTKSGKRLFGDIFENQTTWVTLYVKEHYPLLFQEIENLKETNDTEGLLIVFSKIDLIKPYTKELEACREFISKVGKDYPTLQNECYELLSLMDIPIQK